MNISAEPGQTVPKYKIHWHVVLIHLPISLFLATFLFAFLYIITSILCFELASFITLLLGLLGLIPVTVTGWFTWKGKYKGIRGMLFKRKIITAFVMILICILLVLGQALNTGQFHHSSTAAWHVVYFIGTLLLVLGAITEGFYGGRLNHK